MKGYDSMKKILKLDAKTSTLTEIEVEKVGYEEIHNGVNGYIERYIPNKEFSDNHIDIWIDEEGKLKGLQPNIAVLGENNEIIEMLVGDAIFTSLNEETGESLPLTEEQIQIIERSLIKRIMCNKGEFVPIRVIKAL